MAVLTVTKENFQALVLEATQPVLLDFWAVWCGPCQMVSPLVDELAEEVTDCVIGKVNVDEQPELAQAFGIVSIPTLVTMQNGKVKEQLVGARPKEDIRAMLDRAAE
ncbi:MAG: thioredoxin [Clostridia bacterium]|nr:thioredoxin [Clostridia bacterium]